MSDIVKEDLEYINSVDFIPWEKLRGRTIFITGGTGLIGQNVISALLYINNRRNLGLKVIALVRNIEKANRMFSQQMDDGLPLNLIVGDVTDSIHIEDKIDFIIHGAGPTSSKFFIESPVETINSFYKGTENVLELARKNKIKGMVFLSTMEVYGTPKKGSLVKEDDVGSFDSLTVRNCYPLSKLLCESLCRGYVKEHDTPVVIARLTQTFGPGVEYNDGRVFAEFARCIIEKRDIVLKTKGETERCYLYTADAVTAILILLLNGSSGEAYTVANPNTYCSIAQMAQMVVDDVSNGTIGLVYEIEDVANLGYANTLFMNLDVSKINSLKWNARYGLNDMFKRMIDSFL